jgi:hypothetical protein
MQLSRFFRCTVSLVTFPGIRQGAVGMSPKQQVPAGVICYFGRLGTYVHVRSSDMQGVATIFVTIHALRWLSTQSITFPRHHHWIDFIEQNSVF